MPIGIKCLQSWAVWYLQILLSQSVGVKESFKNIYRFDAVGLTNYRGSGRGGLLSQFKVSKIYSRYWCCMEIPIETIDHSQTVRPEHRPIHFNTHQNLKTACQTLRVITYYILKVKAKYFGFLWGRGGRRIKLIEKIM